jgi:hypothetical protein
VIALELLLYSFDGSPVAPMRPISNSSEMLLAQALRNDTVQAAASARLTTHNSLMMNNGQGRWSVSGTWSRDSCFWSGPGISVIVEAGGRLTWFVQPPFGSFS